MTSRSRRTAERLRRQLARTVTPIAIATNTAGPPITVGREPIAIAITPATVTRAPVFTSRSAATAAYGAAFSFMVTTTGSPAPRIARPDRLPSGVRITDHRNGTATISGLLARQRLDRTR